MLELVIAVLGAFALWLSLKNLDISTFWRTVISSLNLLVLVISSILLGRLALGLLVAALVFGLLVSSVRLAMQKDRLLRYAATQMGEDMGSVSHLFNRVRKQHPVFKLMGPIDTAQLLNLLSQRGRSIDEVERMAVPIALLWVNQREPDLEWLVSRFDTISRIWGVSASESMRVADALTVGAMKSAATFEEMIDSMAQITVFK